MAPAEVDREVMEARQKLHDLNDALARGVHRNELRVAAVAVVDALITVLDLAPEDRRAKIHALLAHYDDLMVKLLN